jgi:hypothetical protein
MDQDKGAATAISSRRKNIAMDSQKSVTFTSGEMSTSYILIQFAISFLSKISPNDIAGFPILAGQRSASAVVKMSSTPSG